MARRIVLSGLIILVVVLIAGLELSGTNQVLSQTALDVKQKLDDTIHTYQGDPADTTDPWPSDDEQQTPPLRESTQAVAPGSSCQWEFSHYESSPYELEWMATVGEAQKHICQTVKEPKHVEASEQIVRRVKSLVGLEADIKFLTRDSMLPAEPHASDEYMSKMHYSRVCYDVASQEFRPASGVGVQLIEPLWGMLRDPFDIFCGDDRLSMEGWENAGAQSKQHIMPQGYAPYFYDTEAESVETANQQWRPQGLPPWHSTFTPEYDPELGTVYTKPVNIHLDLGSSYFMGWSMYQQDAVNPAASGQWFYDHYHARGQKFDRFIAVEVEELNDTLAYSQIPTDLVGKYSLVNVGLTMDDDDKLNTIDMIKRIVRPNDFFVFKLDIDSAPIEMPIIESLLADDPKNGGASALIDELMFEHRKQRSMFRESCELT